jgi:TolA-binding protein
MLRSLGYVSSARATADGSTGPDDKVRLPEYQAYERALEGLYDFRVAQAAASFREILDHDPSNTLARYYLGEAYVRLHRRADALNEWKTALKNDPDYTPAAEAIRKLTAEPASH